MKTIKICNIDFQFSENASFWDSEIDINDLYISHFGKVYKVEKFSISKFKKNSSKFFINCDNNNCKIFKEKRELYTKVNPTDADISEIEMDIKMFGDTYIKFKENKTKLQHNIMADCYELINSYDDIKVTYSLFGKDDLFEYQVIIGTNINKIKKMLILQ